MKDGFISLDECVCDLQGEVVIQYNKLQADPKQGKSLDIGKNCLLTTVNIRCV